MEMLVVVAIIAILLGIAIPTFRNAQRRSRQDADIQAVSALYTEVQSDYEIYGKTGTKSVETPMEEKYDSGNSRAGELDKLELGNGWDKGNIVSITSEKNGDDVRYTASYK